MADIETSTGRSAQFAGKKILATKINGKVKWFNVKSGYGFINRNDNQEDIFIHQTAILKNNPYKWQRSVGDGEEVEFDIVEGEKGLEAVNVTGPDGISVQGSKYANDKRHYRSRFFGRGVGRGYGRRPTANKNGPKRPSLSQGVDSANEDTGPDGDALFGAERRRTLNNQKRSYYCRPIPPSSPSNYYMNRRVLPSRDSYCGLDDYENRQIHLGYRGNGDGTVCRRRFGRGLYANGRSGTNTFIRNYSPGSRNSRLFMDNRLGPTINIYPETRSVISRGSVRFRHGKGGRTAKYNTLNDEAKNMSARGRKFGSEGKIWKEYNYNKNKLDINDETVPDEKKIPERKQSLAFDVEHNSESNIQKTSEMNIIKMKT